MKQTAVEWLENEFQEMCKDFGGIHSDFIERFKQAKEMEKEQIIEAYGHGQNNGYVYAFDKAITINREQYYNETYGK